MNPLALEVREYVKALVAGLVACLAVLASALGGGLTGTEVIGVLSTFIGAFAATFYAPNKAPANTAGSPNLSEQSDLGYGEESLLIRICAVIIVVALTIYLLQILF